MKNGSSFFRLLLVICIVLIHIHMSLYTIGNMTNPVTFVMMYLRSDTDFIWIFTGFCVQLIVTALAAYLILGWKRLWCWFLILILGLFTVLYALDYLNFYYSLLPDIGLSSIYYKIYEYPQAFEGGVYYIFLQLSAILLYGFFDFLLKIKGKNHGKSDKK